MLDDAQQRDLVEQTRPRLQEETVWSLDDPRELVKAVVAYPRPKQRGDRSGFFVSAHGRYGQYARRLLKDYAPPGQPFGREAVDAVLRFLFLALKRYGIVEQVRTGEVPGYQINPDALRWLPGSGEEQPVDRTRLLAVGEMPPEVNRYFVACYQRFIDLKCTLEAREHTAQVTAADRQEREDRFREGDLSLLFCSPPWNWASISPSSIWSTCATSRRRRPITPNAADGRDVAVSRPWFTPIAPDAVRTISITTAGRNKWWAARSRRRASIWAIATCSAPISTPCGWKSPSPI